MQNALNQNTEAKPSRKEFLKKMSTEYEARGLSEVCVDNEQIAALHTENNRERAVILSLKKDIELLHN